MSHGTFDQRMFNDNNSRHMPNEQSFDGRTWPNIEWVNSITVIKNQVPDLNKRLDGKPLPENSYALPSLAERFGVDVGRAHNAKDDVRTLLCVLLKVFKQDVKKIVEAIITTKRSTEEQAADKKRKFEEKYGLLGGCSARCKKCISCLCVNVGKPCTEECGCGEGCQNREKDGKYDPPTKKRKRLV